MDIETAILKAYSLGVKQIKLIEECKDYVKLVGSFSCEDITYLFYRDGRIVTE